jgi:potassium/hydrogen antiporter
VGLVLAVLLAFVVRPLLVGPLLLPVRLTVGERVFVLWSGLKGAVPILLGTYVLGTGGPANRAAYEVIFVVVAFSVIVQGGLVPAVARWCRVRMQDKETRPWAVGVRLRDEPQSARQYRVYPGASAEGRTVGELHRSEDVWISLIVRDGSPLRVRADTTLRAGDEVLLLVEPPAEPGPAFESG